MVRAEVLAWQCRAFVTRGGGLKHSLSCTKRRGRARSGPDPCNPCNTGFLSVSTAAGGCLSGESRNQWARTLGGALVWGEEVSGWVRREGWDAGRCLDERGLKKRIFHSGLEHGVRRQAWMFLLGVFAWSSTRQERQQERQRLQKAYQTLKKQWTSITPEQAAKCAKPLSRFHFVCGVAE